MNKPKIERPEEYQPAPAFWSDRKKYVTINFKIQKPKDVKVDIQQDKMILCCKNDTDDVFYNELYFYDTIEKNDSRERVYDRTINVLLRKVKPDFSWPRLQKDEARPSWIAVDFDNWRDWENEEDDGREEFEKYADMIQEIQGQNKGVAPSMDDLSDSD